MQANKQTGTGYTQVSDAIMQDDGVGKNELLTYLSIASFGQFREGADCTAYPGLSSIATRARISKPTVKRALKVLVSLGYIDKQNRRKPGSVEYTSNYYTVHMVAKQKLTQSLYSGGGGVTVNLPPVHTEPTPGVTVSSESDHSESDQYKQGKGTPPEAVSSGPSVDSDNFMMDVVRKSYAEHGVQLPPAPPQAPVSPPPVDTDPQPGSEVESTVERAQQSELIKRITAKGREHYKRYTLSPSTAFELWRMGNQVGDNAVYLTFERFCERKGDKLNIADVTDTDFIGELCSHFGFITQEEREAQQRAHDRHDEQARQKREEDRAILEQEQIRAATLLPALTANGVNHNSPRVYFIASVLWSEGVAPQDITAEKIREYSAGNPFLRVDEQTLLLEAVG